jgi:hypothetical protein
MIRKSTPVAWGPALLLMAMFSWACEGAPIQPEIVLTTAQAKPDGPPGLKDKGGDAELSFITYYVQGVDAGAGIGLSDSTRAGRRMTAYRFRVSM